MRYLLLFYTVLLAACGTPPPSQVAPAAKPIPISSGTEPSELGLGPIMARLNDADSKISVQYGWVCQAAEPVALPSGRVPLAIDDVDKAFRSVLGPLNYLLEKDAESVFEAKSKAPLKLGGTLTRVLTSVCLPFTGSTRLNFGSTSQIKGSAFVEVAWELYSEQERRVVYSVKTQGSFDTKELISGGLYTVVLGAWKESLRNLASDPKFHSEIIRPRSSPAPQPTGKST